VRAAERLGSGMDIAGLHPRALDGWMAPPGIVCQKWGVDETPTEGAIHEEVTTRGVGSGQGRVQVQGVDASGVGTYVAGASDRFWRFSPSDGLDVGFQACATRIIVGREIPQVSAMK